MCISTGDLKQPMLQPSPRRMSDIVRWQMGVQSPTLSRPRHIRMKVHRYAVYIYGASHNKKIIPIMAISTVYVRKSSSLLNWVDVGHWNRHVLDGGVDQSVGQRFRDRAGVFVPFVRHVVG
eukprot:309523_1